MGKGEAGEIENKKLALADGTPERKQAVFQLGATVFTGVVAGPIKVECPSPPAAAVQQLYPLPGPC
jgi:hypothetical protein